MAPPQAVDLLVKATLFSIMFALGLGIRGQALLVLRQRPALILRVLIGSCLLVPLVALLLLKLPLSQNLSVSARFGIALMALSPSAPLTLRKAGLKGGDRELAALLQVGAAITAIVSIPLMADLFRSAYRVDGWDILPSQVALQVVQAQVLPLLLGHLVRRWRPALANRFELPLAQLANGLLLAMIALVLWKTAPLLVPFAAANWLALAFMAGMVVAALVIGYVLAGKDLEERTTVALVTSMRNPGLALLFSSLYSSDKGPVNLAILVYLLMTLLLSMPFLRWQKRLRLAGGGQGPAS